MKANKFLVPGLVIGLLFATVGIAQATGYWIVSGKQMIDPGAMTSSADVRGWMSVEQIAQGLQVDVATVYALTGIPSEVPPDTALKDLEQIVPDFEVSTVRDALAVYLGEGLEGASAGEGPDATVVTAGGTPPEPVVAEATPIPPTPTAEPLTAEPVPTAHTPLGDGSGAGDGSGEGVDEDGYLAGADIRGQHTLAEIADRGEIELDQLLAELGLADATAVNMPLRELVKNGVIDEVVTVRAVVEALQQK